MTENDLAHVAAANRYAKDVVEGRVVACKWVRLACERHLVDLTAQRRKAFAYRFDEGKAEDICRFVELFRHVKGQWAKRREAIRLEPWQKFILCSVFGWVRKSDGFRRFRTAYIEVPRKNGKSLLSAAVGLYTLAADEEVGSEVYCGATTEKQALEVFRPAQAMAKGSVEFQEAFGVEVAASKIWIPGDGSRLEPLIGQPGDGASPHCAIIDEFHEHRNDVLIDTMESGMGAREQPLTFVITTAGTDTEGPCGTMNGMVKRVLEGKESDPELFGIIYTVDDPNDWQTDEAIRMANPNAGVSVSLEYLRSQVTRAIASPRRQATVKTKHFNIWVHSRQAWLDMEAWRACGEDGLSIEDFAGEPCMVGLDLASKIDIASRVAVFEREGTYYLFGKHWVPEDRIAEVDDSKYLGWVTAGHLTATPGNIIDYDYIEEDLLELGSECEVLELPYDPHQATQLATRMRNEGLPMVEVRQNTANLSPPMRELEALVRAGKVRHPNDPVLTWMFGNVTTKENAKGELYPRRERREDKIDGAVATLLAIGRWMAHDAEGARSPYEDGGLLVL